MWWVVAIIIAVIVIGVIVLSVCMKKKTLKNNGETQTATKPAKKKKVKLSYDEKYFNKLRNKYAKAPIKELEMEAFYGKSVDGEACKKYLFNLFFNSEEDGCFGMDIKHAGYFEPFAEKFSIWFFRYGSYDPRREGYRGNFILEYVKNMTKAGLVKYLFDGMYSNMVFLHNPAYLLHQMHKKEFDELDKNPSSFYKKLIYNPESKLYDKRVYNVAIDEERDYRIRLVFCATMKNLIENQGICKLDEKGNDTDELYTLDELLSLSYGDLRYVLSKRRDD